MPEGTEFEGKVDLQNSTISTAGTYISINGLFLFAIGIRPHDGNIPIVRLGGHREAQETGWQCALREVYEEARLNIQPVSSQKTYLIEWGHLDMELREIEWINQVEQEPDPFLVVRDRRKEHSSLSLMYLARAGNMPTPSAEVKGLLLLSKEEIHRLCQKPETLEDYLYRGGRAIMTAEFDKSLVLEPFAQLSLLCRILDMQPEFEADLHLTNSMGRSCDDTLKL
jgi:hypothetical protein